MNVRVVRWILGVTLASGLCASSVFAADESTKTLPTLLIKGEVVSLDTTDPSAVLLKVKDRYGFETPIYLPAETKIAQGDKTLTTANLTTGTTVEVEYNFDINTAKRHAVSVKVAAPAAAEAAPAAIPPAAAAPSTPTGTAPAPAMVAPAAPVMPPAMPAVAAPAPQAPAAPAASEPKMVPANKTQ